MHIERRYTEANQGAYAGIEFRSATSEIRNPDGSVVFKLENMDVPSSWSQVAADILAQKYFRKAGVAKKLKQRRRERRAVLAVALRPRREGPERPPRKRTLRQRDRLPPGLRPPRRHLDLLGLEGRLFRHRGGRPRLLRRARLHARDPEGRAELAAMVQHRPPLGLWHRRPRPGPFLRRPLHQEARAVEVVLRAPAAACLLHPVRQRRPRQRGRHHGSVGPRGAAVQVRLGHRLQLLARCAAKASACRAAASRRA